MVEMTVQSEPFNPHEQYRFECPNFYWVHIICIKCQCGNCRLFKQLLNTKPYPRIECNRVQR
jgi:hypothetical protein